MAYGACAFDATLEGSNFLLLGVDVEVRRISGELEPLYSDRAGTPLSNPFESSDGKVVFYCAGGAFNVKLSKGVYERTIPKAVGLAQESDLIARPQFAGPTFYIADDGNDTTGDGSNAHPWASWAHIAAILGLSDCQNTDVSIQAIDGDAYDEIVTIDQLPVGARSLNFIGNHGAPANVKGLNFASFGNAQASLDGFEVDQAVLAFGYSSISLAGAAMRFVGDGDLAMLEHGSIDALGLIETIVGNKSSHIFATDQTKIRYLPATTTLVSVPDFSLAYAAAGPGGQIFAPLWQTVGAVTGTATGDEHFSYGGAVISTSGDGFPGSTPGSELGGYYD